MKDFVDRALFDDFAEPHDRDPVGDFGDDAHVVGDQQHRHAALGLEALDQREDFGLRGDVERRRRLVSDQDVGRAGERHGDHGALPLAPGEFERIAVDGFFGIGDFHLAQQFDGASPRRLRIEPAVQADRFDNLKPNCMNRRQRTHRLLKNQPDPSPANVAHRAAA